MRGDGDAYVAAAEEDKSNMISSKLGRSSTWSLEQLFMPRVGPYPTVISFCAHPYINYYKNNLRRYPIPNVPAHGPAALSAAQISGAHALGGWSELPKEAPLSPVDR